MGEIKEQVFPVRVDYVCDECNVGRMRKTGEITMEPGVTRHKCDHVDCGREQDFKDIVYPAIRYEGKTFTANEAPAPHDPEMISDGSEPEPEPASETDQSGSERMDFPTGDESPQKQ